MSLNTELQWRKRKEGRVHASMAIEGGEPSQEKSSKEEDGRKGISFSEKEHSILVSCDHYSHAKTHFLVHALSFLFAMFKVALNKEGFQLSL